MTPNTLTVSVIETLPLLYAMSKTVARNNLSLEWNFEASHIPPGECGWAANSARLYPGKESRFRRANIVLLLTILLRFLVFTGIRKWETFVIRRWQANYHNVELIAAFEEVKEVKKEEEGVEETSKY